MMNQKQIVQEKETQIHAAFFVLFNLHAILVVILIAAAVLLLGDMNRNYYSGK